MHTVLNEPANHNNRAFLDNPLCFYDQNHHIHLTPCSETSITIQLIITDFLLGRLPDDVFIRVLKRVYSDDAKAFIESNAEGQSHLTYIYSNSQFCASPRSMKVLETLLSVIKNQKDLALLLYAKNAYGVNPLTIIFNHGNIIDLKIYLEELSKVFFAIPSYARPDLINPSIFKSFLASRDITKLIIFVRFLKGLVRNKEFNNLFIPDLLTGYYCSQKIRSPLRYAMIGGLENVKLYIELIKEYFKKSNEVINKVYSEMKSYPSLSSMEGVDSGEIDSYLRSLIFEIEITENANSRSQSMSNPVLISNDIKKRKRPDAALTRQEIEYSTKKARLDDELPMYCSSNPCSCPYSISISNSSSSSISGPISSSSSSSSSISRPISAPISNSSFISGPISSCQKVNNPSPVILDRKNLFMFFPAPVQNSMLVPVPDLVQNNSVVLPPTHVQHMSTKNHSRSTSSNSSQSKSPLPPFIFYTGAAMKENSTLNKDSFNR